jgi:hypothetical protein
MYLAFGPYTNNLHFFCPPLLMDVAADIYQATYSHLPNASKTLDLVLEELQSYPQNEPVRYAEVH